MPSFLILDSSVCLVADLVEHEREILEAALRESEGVVGGPTGAAVKLGIPRTKRLLSADSQYGHRQLHPLENFIILCVLGKRRELGEPSPHSAWLCISGGKEISGRLVRLGQIASEVIPNSIEVDALAASHEPFGIRTMKIEMPNTGVQQNLLPRLDAWNRCVHYNQPLNFVRIHCSVGVSPHIADVVCDPKRLVISQRRHDCANVFGLRLLVVPTFRLR